MEQLRYGLVEIDVCGLWGGLRETGKDEPMIDVSQMKCEQSPPYIHLYWQIVRKPVSRASPPRRFVKCHSALEETRF